MDDVPAVGSVAEEMNDELSTTEGSEEERIVGRGEGMMMEGGGGVGRSSKGKDRARSSSESGLGKWSGEESSSEFPGQRYMRKVHQERQKGLLAGKSSARGGTDGARGDASVESTSCKLEIDPRKNFGVRHLFNEVGRGKQLRQQMHASGCECCAGYYEQAAKDLHGTKDGGAISRHQQQISRHRHFHPPPLTPPGFWQLGFPDTPRVEKINRMAEQNKMLKHQERVLQARNGNGPFKLKES